MHDTRFMLIAAGLAPAIASAPAFRQDVADGWTICMRDLELVETIIERADERGIVTVNEYGIRTPVELDRVFFAVPTRVDQAPAPETLATVPLERRSPVRLISLNDGQVIRGTLHAPEDPAMLEYTIVAGTSTHGRSSVTLERVLSVGDVPFAQLLAAVGAPLDEDIVLTRTGDRIGGFIELVGTTTVIDAGGDLLEIDAAGIEGVLIANPIIPVPGAYIETDDGLRLRTSEFDFDLQQPLMVSVDAESLGLAPDARTAWIFDPSAPRGLHVVHAGERVESLGGIEPELVEPTGERAWTPTPTIIDEPGRPSALASIDLHAPLRAVYPLPRGASRFACTLEAPIEAWTDCVARVTGISYDGTRTELVRQRLNAEQPSVEVNAELAPETARLELLIEPGVHGPIQDRVIVRQPRIVVRD